MQGVNPFAECFASVRNWRQSPPAPNASGVPSQILDAKRQKMLDKGQDPEQPRTRGQRAKAAKAKKAADKAAEKAAKAAEKAAVKAAKAADKAAKAAGKSKADAGDGPGPAKRKQQKTTSSESSGNVTKSRTSGYLLFCAAERPATKAAHPDASPKELMSLLAAKWKEAPEEQQLQYKQQAVQHNAEQQAAAGNAATAPAQAAAGTSKVSKAAPKSRGTSGYMLFSKEHRADVKAANPEAPAKEILSLLAAAWRATPSDEKEGYNDRAKHENALQKGSSEPQRIAEPVPAARKPRPQSGYMRFYSQQREVIKASHPGASAQEIMSLLGAAWRSLTDEEKANYKQQGG